MFTVNTPHNHNPLTFADMKRMGAVRPLILLIVALFVIALASRNTLLQWVFKKEQAHLKTAYHLNLNVSSISFAGWTGARLTDVVLVPDNADTLARIKMVEFRPSILSLLTGKLSFTQLKIDTADITAYRQPERNNLSFLKGYGAKETAKSNSTGFYKKAEDLKDRFLRLLNTAVEINSLNLSYRDTSFAESIFIPQLHYDRHNLSALLINRQVDDTLQLSAEVVKSNKDFKVAVQHSNNNLVYLPFLNAEHGFKCRFKSVIAEVELNESGGTLTIDEQVEVSNFHIQHWRLAKEDVVFPKAGFKGTLKINEEAVELDSSSTVTLNNASFKIFSSYVTRPDTVFALNINMPETASDTFFNALPGGMFNTLKGISCSGTLAYNLQFALDTRQPDSLVFESKLSRKNFHIIHYGEENYARINEPFLYDAFSGDQFIRHIIAGPENPAFTSFQRISPNLPAAILQSEDPSFMVHRGFVPEAFKESIAKNYKEHRFARGGSTISMQLVKNVFLNHNKTVSRKAEEALIVYLIENLGLVSKERMLEVYLNVIEWGPNVYGIGEASRFYFNKTPAELNLPECIFLAAIIPNPKFFRYQFDKQGEIKPYMSDFFKLIENRMVMRGYLSEHDTINFVPRVKLSGPARQFVIPNDTLTPAESLPSMEESD